MGGAAVLVVEVVGVFPDVEGEEGLEALGDGVRGAGLLGDDQGAVGIRRQPDPAGAEKAYALGDELFLEGFEGAPLIPDLTEDAVFSPGLGPRLLQGMNAGSELLEVQVMVQDLAGVVEDRLTGLRGGQLITRLSHQKNEFLQGQLLIHRTGDELVQVVHIGPQVLSVMEFQSLRTDYR